MTRTVKRLTVREKHRRTTRVSSAPLSLTIPSHPKVERFNKKYRKRSYLLNKYIPEGFLIERMLAGRLENKDVKPYITVRKKYGDPRVDEDGKLSPSMVWLLKRTGLKVAPNANQFSIAELMSLQPRIVTLIIEVADHIHNTTSHAAFMKAVPLLKRAEVAELRTAAFRKGKELELSRALKYYLIAVSHASGDGKPLSKIIYSLTHTVFEEESHVKLRRAYDKWRSGKGFKTKDVVRFFESTYHLRIGLPADPKGIREFYKLHKPPTQHPE